MAITVADLIVTFSGDDSPLKQSMEGVKGGLASFGGVATKLIGGAVLGGATAAAGAIVGIGAAAFNVSQDTERAAADMAASLGLPIEEAEKFAEVARRVYGNNFADSVGDAATAVQELARIMGVTADDPALQGLAEDAFRLRDAFGVDVAESVDAAKTLMENFGISGDEAFNMIAAGYQKGLDRSGDFLDTIGEYSVQFASGGASAEEFFGLLDSGLQGGMLGTDKAADAFKEFRVRIADGSKTTADALAQIGISVDDLTAGMADGSISAADAFTLVQEALAATTDPVVQMQAGVGLLGTQFEDLGTETALALTLTNEWAAGSEDAIGKIDAKYSTFGDAVSAMWRRLVVSVSPFTDKLLELVNDAMPAVLGAFDRFDATVGPAMERAQRIIDQVVNYVKGLFTGFKTSADTQLTGPMEYWRDWLDQNMPRIQQIITTVLGAIQTFWAAWGDEIMGVVNFVFGTIGTMINVSMQTIGDVITLALQLLTGDWDGALTTLLGIAERIWAAIQQIVGTAIDGVGSKIREIDWAELGRNIIEGIAAGISSAAGKIADAAKRAAQDAYDRAKRWLGISSPSKKTAKDIGEPFAEGIGEGIDAGLRRLNGQLNTGLTSLMGGVSVPRGMAAGAGAPIAITINIGNGDMNTAQAARGGVLAALRQAGLA